MTQKDVEMADEKPTNIEENNVAEEQQADQEHDYDQQEAAEETQPPMDSELANIIEAALYAADEPLGVRKLIALFPDEAQPTKVDIQNVILTLQEQCEHRGIELRRIGIGWRYQTKEKYAPWLRKLSGQKAPRYSRALLETLSIIAYRQPVTRGDIEEIRGVGVSSETIRTLEEREWITQIGHRDVPGRPALFGTTQGFLEYFNMTSLSELPELIEKRELRAIAKDLNLTLPMDGVQDESNRPDDQGAEAETADVIELHPKDDDIDTDQGPTISDDDPQSQESDEVISESSEVEHDDAETESGEDESEDSSKDD